MASTFLTAFAWDHLSLLVLRLLTAVGIGAEYAAVNAAISEFIRVRHRGKTNADADEFLIAVHHFGRIGDPLRP